jgi:hypothetical protein
MKTKLIFSILALVLFIACKKKTKSSEKIIISGIIYKDCYTIAANTKYYRVYLSYVNKTPIEFNTDANGVFNFELDKSTSKDHFIISSDPNSNHVFSAFYGTGENLNVGVLRENENNMLILKLKTNHGLTNLDTIKYAFQYSNMELPIHGPLTRDTIIGIYTKLIISPNSNPNGELNTLWWSLNKATVGSNDNQVDYTIHGCAGVADTAYIVVP